MSTFLKNHPFAVQAFFEWSLVLTFAAPARELEGHIPECLALDTFDNRVGFIAVAMVEAKKLRPQGFPAFLGNDFFLIGYRIFVRYTTRSGRRLRGLYIVRSETNRRLMEVLGKMFTRYRYVRTPIQCHAERDHIRVTSPGTGFCVEVEKGRAEVPLPVDSPFSDWHQARRFAGPLPFTFSYDPITNEVLSVQGVRQAWNPQPVAVKKFQVPFLESLKIDQLSLASAFLVRKIPYRWNKGVVEKWEG